MKRLCFSILCLYMMCTGATATITDDLIINGTSKALKPSAPLHSDHKSHDMTGSHGMVLFTDGVELYASHLPLYYSPHDYQLIYKVESTHKAKLIRYLRQANANSSSTGNMITLLPAHFDLNKLIDGERFSISSQLYKGHFERGGTNWLDESEITFAKLLFKRRLSHQYKPAYADGDIHQKSFDENWTSISLGDKQLYIHHVSERPSFDALFVVNGCQKTAENEVSKSVPSVAQIQDTFTHCDAPKLVYFETEDFAL